VSTKKKDLKIKKKSPELTNRKPGLKASTVEKRILSKLNSYGVSVDKVHSPSKDSSSFRYIYSDPHSGDHSGVNKALKELRSIGTLRKKVEIKSGFKGTAHGDWKDHAK